MSSPLPLRRAILALAAVTGLVPPAMAQLAIPLPVPRLVTNLNTGPNGEGSNPEGFRDVDGKLIFEAYTPDTTSRIIWQSDGTDAGTRPVVNPLPDLVATWDPRTWVKAGGKWFFLSARASTPGLRLWTTDGSGPGTAELGNLPGITIFPAATQNLTACGGLLYFTVNHGFPVYTVLWRSDGTTAGTFPLQVVAPGSVQPGKGFDSITQLTSTLAGDALWFVADNSRIFRSGGTVATTVEVDYTGQFPLGSIGALTASDDGIYFHHWNNNTYRSILAKTGGTAESTVKIGGDEDQSPGQWQWLHPEDFFYWKGHLYFSAFTPQARRQIFRSDGTPQGTALAIEFEQDSNSNRPRIVGATDDLLFVMADDVKNGIEFWRSDGSTKGSKRLTDNPKNTFIDRFKMIGGRLWFFGPGKEVAQLCVSDGTPKGTHPVKPASAKKPFYSEEVASAGGVIFFSGGDDRTGMELWKTNGKAKGTVLVKNIVTGEASGIDVGRDVAVLGKYYYFTGRKRLNQNTQLWRSDGTAKGTTLFRDFPNHSEYEGPSGLLSAGGRLHFSRQYRLFGPDQVWSSNGSSQGTILEKNFLEMPEAKQTATAGGKTFTLLYEGLHVLRPGHREGPLLIEAAGDWFPPGAEYHSRLVELNGRIYFAGLSQTGVPALWSTDGTEAGTVQVKETGIPPYDIIAHAGSLYFLTRFDGMLHLWKSDGSTAGTVEVAQLSRNDADWLTLEASAGKIYIFGKEAFGPERRLYCWEEGETEAVLLKSFTAAASNSKPHFTHSGNGLLYFSFDDATKGAELWRSDGSAEGTLLVKDIKPGTASSKPANPVSVGFWTYFTADNGVNGIELWRTDGTPGNTAMIADMLGGAPGSEPEGLRLVGERLLFSAITDKGRELWAIDKAGEIPPSPGGVIITVPPPASAFSVALPADPEALLGYAFNVAQAGDTRPVFPGSGTSGYPAISTGGQVLRVEYLRRKDGSLIYKPQYSTSLEPDSFLPMSGTVTVTDIDAEWERVIAEQPYDPVLTPRLFARVEVKAK